MKRSKNFMKTFYLLAILAGLSASGCCSKEKVPIAAAIQLRRPPLERKIILTDPNDDGTITLSEKVVIDMTDEILERRAWSKYVMNVMKRYKLIGKE